jgi:site-specific recombinase XerD
VHGHRVLRVLGKGDKVALVPLPPAGGRAIERAVDGRVGGPILRSRTGSRMDRHCATRILHALARTAGVSTARMHPHMLRHTFVTTMLDAGVDLRDVQIAARHADPRTTMRYDRARKTWIDTPTTSWRRTWPQEPKRSFPCEPKAAIECCSDHRRGRRNPRAAPSVYSRATSARTVEILHSNVEVG